MSKGDHNYEDTDFDKWLNDRPSIIQEMGKSYPADRVYILKLTGHRVIIQSYNEDGTVTISIGYNHNLLVFQRSVFGVNPNDLIENNEEDYYSGNLLGSEEVLSEFSLLLEAANHDTKKTLLKCVWTIEKIISDIMTKKLNNIDSSSVSTFNDCVELKLSKESYLLKPQIALNLAAELMHSASRLQQAEEKANKRKH